MKSSKVERDKVICPCCGNFVEFDEDCDRRYIGEICPICFWNYDVVGQENPDIAIGPNRVSLNQAKENYKIFGAKERRVSSYVRKPFENELPENNI